MLVGVKLSDEDGFFDSNPETEDDDSFDFYEEDFDEDINGNDDSEQVT